MFSKDNDLIKRIMNLILIVWIIIAVVVLYNSVVNLLFDNYKYTYDEYQLKYCNKVLDENNSCEREYNHHQLNQKNNMRGQVKVLINSAGNIVIIGSFILLLNKNKKTE